MRLAKKFALECAKKTEGRHLPPASHHGSTLRQRLAAVFLWTVLVLVGTLFGASVYQRVSLIPEWGGALPQSVVDYFGDARAGEAIDRFWTFATAPTTIAVVLALAFNWAAVARRRWVAAGAVVFFVMLAWTGLFFVPRGVVPLMLHAGEGLAPEEITRMAQAWIFWDWFRMAGTLAAYLCFIKANSLRDAG